MSIVKHSQSLTRLKIHPLTVRFLWIVMCLDIPLSALHAVWGSPPPICRTLRKMHPYEHIRCLLETDAFCYPCPHSTLQGTKFWLTAPSVKHGLLEHWHPQPRTHSPNQPLTSYIQEPWKIRNFGAIKIQALLPPIFPKP